MLEQLLQEIRSGGTLEIETLATRLGTSPQLIKAMLDHLQRAGYLQAYTSTCSIACNGCSWQSACTLQKGGQPKLWQNIS
ncbi:MAG: FeoC-like transcriptional regulator [Anaerolineae bacterium]